MCYSLGRGVVEMLKKFILKNPFQLFLTILLPFLLSSLVLLFVQSSFLSRNFENFALDMVYNQQKTDLQNTSRNVSVIAQSAKSVSTTAFFDDTIKDLLYSDVPSEDFAKYQLKLEAYKNIYPFLKSIYIYNGHRMHVIPSTGFIYDRFAFGDKGIFPILDDIEHHKSHSMVLRRIPNVLYGIASDEKEIYVYSYLFFDSQVSSGKVSEAIILNISEEAVSKSINSSDHKNENRIFIVNQDGQLMSKDNKHPLLSDLNGDDYIKVINTSKELSGTLRMDVEGVDSFITYAATDAFDWKLISITPYQEIVQDVQKMRKKTYLLVLCFIIGSILLSFYFSRRLYAPIKLVIQNFRVLESEKRNEFYYRKQIFLRKMVLSGDIISGDTLHSRFNTYKVDLEPSDSYLLLLVKIDRFSEFCSKYNLGDRNLLKFGMVNIISELVSKAYKHECIEVEEDQILVLIQYRSDALYPSENEQLVSLAKEIQTSTQQFLNIATTITCGEVFETLYPLNFHYLKTLDLSYYRLILGHQCIIFHENIKYVTEDFKYPQDLEKELTDALIQGQFIEAKQALSFMIGSASKYSFTILNSVLIRMLLSIRHAIEVVEANQSIKVNFNFNTYLANLQKMETLEDIRADFYHLFDNLSLELESKKDNKYIKLLEDVNQIIHEDFANLSLSLDSIAEKVNLSPSYLGKLYKKHRLISVTDYMNNVRLAYASDQIASTEETINDIMEKSGFSSRSHFFTLFKKAYGVTPNQYRSNAKKSVPV
jgi:two-component system response regulator YesN